MYWNRNAGGEPALPVTDIPRHCIPFWQSTILTFPAPKVSNRHKSLNGLYGFRQKLFYPDGANSGGKHAIMFHRRQSKEQFPALVHQIVNRNQLNKILRAPSIHLIGHLCVIGLKISLFVTLLFVS